MRFLLVVVLFVPLILHMHAIPCSEEVQARFPYYKVDYDIFNWGKSSFLYLVGIGAIIWLVLSEWEKDAYFYLIAAYAFLVDISALASKYQTVTWWGMPNYCEGALAMGCYALLFFAAKELMHRNIDRNRVAAVLGGVMLLMAVFCALRLVDQDYLNWPLFKAWIFGNSNSVLHINSNADSSAYGTLMNSNVLGTFAALLAPFFVARKSWGLALVALGLAVASNSRASWVGIAAGVSWIALVRPGLRKVAGVVIGAVATVAVIHHRWVFWDRVKIWGHTFDILPFGLLGEGPGAYALQVKQGGWGVGVVLDRPHDFYLQVWHASGFLSVLLLIILFGKFLYESRRSGKALPFSAAVVAYLVNMFFTDSSTSVAPLFWVVLGTGVAAI